ncbi:MAG: 16S rRNA (cytidine(1402)-2'-O)-methyltransferase [Kiritimatiellae bacterium]|nr:16S rRNA (cytidine(1402)-2'-O)-methyltransferase [Kiritimatiellia bacterium]
MEPGLYIVGTPIGHLQDITLRALDVLRQAEVVVAEDTRHTRILLERHEIPARLFSCHRFNEASRAQAILDRVRAGAVVALVTDSGMPGVSDPGSRVVAACRAAGLPVTCLPGPSAVTAAVALSGMGGAAFSFAGFLPRKEGARRRRLEELAAREEPVVLFESPFRLLRTLEEIEAVMGPRPVFLGRELTKQFEESRVGTPSDLRAAFAGRSVKGELVLVISPAGRRGEPDDARPDGPAEGKS